MRLSLWHFDVRPFSHDGAQLLTFRHRADLPVLYNNLPYQQIDPTHALKKPDTTKRAIALIRSLDFRFPVPAPSRLIFPTLLLRDHPLHEEWLKFFDEGSYSQDDYRHDSKLFWDNYLRIKSHKELFDRTIKKRSYIHRLKSKEQQARSAAVHLWFFAYELEQLNRFYQPLPIPPQVQNILDEFRDLKKYLPAKRK